MLLRLSRGAPSSHGIFALSGNGLSARLLRRKKDRVALADSWMQHAVELLVWPAGRLCKGPKGLIHSNRASRTCLHYRYLVRAGTRAWTLSASKLVRAMPFRFGTCRR